MCVKKKFMRLAGFEMKSIWPIFKTEMLIYQRWYQGGNSGGDKTVKVPTASEARKIFTDHTFLIGSKFDKTL